MTNQIPARARRVAIVLSPAMSIALEQLAARNNLTLAAQARMILRQGLDRTISTPGVQDALKRYHADRGVRQWREDVQLDHEVETDYAQSAPQTE
jgi:hypothetical protein